MREDLLEVGLLQRRSGAPEQRRPAEAAQHALPERRSTQQRTEAREQVDAGLHHGGGMEEGRHRRRRFHGVGQPEMERQLRRFGEGGDDDEAEDPGIGPGRQRRGSASRSSSEMFQVPERTCSSTPPAISDRPPRPVTTSAWWRRGGRPGARASKPISRNEVTAVSSQKTNSADEAVGEDQAQHRAHEEQQDRHEAAAVRVAFEVGAGVDQDEGADAGDGEPEDKAQAVDEEAQAQAEDGHPVDAEFHRLTGDDLRRSSVLRPTKIPAGTMARIQPAARPRFARNQRREQRHEERREQQQDGEAVEVEGQRARPVDSVAGA